MLRLLLPLLVLFVVPHEGAAQTGAELATIKEQELEDVRQRISRLKKSMDRSARERDRLTGELEEAELTIGQQRQVLKDLERDRDAAVRRRSELDATLAKRKDALDGEMRELASQVRAAYMSGRQEKIKLLLNQRDPATLGRMMAYYGYLNDHRAGNIDTITGTIRELARLRSEVAAEEARLAAIAEREEDELERLRRAQADRKALLAKLDDRIADEGREVERLAAEERDLTRLIAELSTILSDYPISSEDPFSAHRGRLTWPVAGTLVHDFGQPRVGGVLRWNGVVLAAPRGREVRSVYHGRVVFADWLAGMGLLVIVDHGEGYMTLYGYNETLLKGTGDWVAPGDVIATVGDSGGQAQASLYFELRKGTKPLDPRQWVTRRPGSS